MAFSIWRIFTYVLGLVGTAMALPLLVVYLDGDTASFVFLYFALVLATTFAGALAGLDLFSAFTVSLSMVGNVGPAFGDFGPASNYGALANPLKWFYCFAMLAGRLEIYTFLILVGSLFRRRGRHEDVR